VGGAEGIRTPDPL